MVLRATHLKICIPPRKTAYWEGTFTLPGEQPHDLLIGIHSNDSRNTIASDGFVARGAPSFKTLFS